MNAWKQKAKGIIIFHYHSKTKQVPEKGITIDAEARKFCLSYYTLRFYERVLYRSQKIADYSDSYQFCVQS